MQTMNEIIDRLRGKRKLTWVELDTLRNIIKKQTNGERGTHKHIASTIGHPSEQVVRHIMAGRDPGLKWRKSIAEYFAIKEAQLPDYKPNDNHHPPPKSEFKFHSIRQIDGKEYHIENSGPIPFNQFVTALGCGHGYFRVTRMCPPECDKLHHHGCDEFSITVKVTPVK